MHSKCTIGLTLDGEGLILTVQSANASDRGFVRSRQGVQGYTQGDAYGETSINLTVPVNSTLASTYNLEKERIEMEAFLRGRLQTVSVRFPSFLLRFWPSFPSSALSSVSLLTRLLLFDFPSPSPPSFTSTFQDHLSAS